MNNRRDAGFTLIELLVVVVVLGILATVAAAQYTKAREKAYVTALKNDLKVLAIQQELYHGRAINYGNVSDLTDFRASAGVNISITYRQPSGWAATASHAGLPGEQCGIFVGTASASDASPATQEGEIACTP